MVPNGWEVKELQFLCSKIAVGLAISVTPFMRSSGVKLIRNQNIKRNYFNSDSVVYIDEVFANSNKSKKVRHGDVVAVRTGSNIGEACVVPKDFDGALTFTTLIARPNPDLLDSFYLSTHINSDRGISEVNRLCAGGGKPNLNSGELKRYRLLTPPLPEQKKIAQILSTWDKAITTTEQLLANSQQQKKALMQQLLTGKKRLLDKNGVRFSGEWKFQSISQISKRIQRKSDGEDHPILTISSLSGFVRQDERYSRYMAGESVKNYILLKKGEFAYNKGNSKTYEFGCIFDLDSYKSGLVPHVYVCFKLHQGLSHRYFKYLFEADYLKPQLGALVNTGVRNNGLLNIKPAEFMNTKVPVPCLDEQEQIADVLHASSETINKLQLKLDALKQEKKALMQQLLTGKRRVLVS
ncbi:restriction endonuclease subunit S [Shewanella xiamenensis]|uniref:restriction endonuclease subunit S n=1 Tax=Shewanella xiamenensis TaxID=332186 RepID=UPI00244A0CBC|nr:restriction endonuclease subunit S [Shewanella xiamenensis]MDH1626879.1 restriction endonuclease subunit S [Shewanella xiamenensis]